MKTRTKSIIGVVVLLAVLGYFVGPDETSTSEDAAPASEEAAPDVIATLGGITSGFITTQMEDRGLQCQGPRQETSRVSWRCTGAQGQTTHSVEFLGQSPTRVEYVTGSALQGTAEQAAQFLSFIASLPYEGADPTATQAWVTDNAGDDAEMVVGGIKIRLSGPASAPSVSLFPVGSDWD